MRVLVLNAGSSSLKSSVLESGRREPLAAMSVGWGADASRLAGRDESVGQLVDGLAQAGVDAQSIAAVGHRFVHGGPAFRRPVLIDDAVLSTLEELLDLAPLHNGVALDAIRAARRRLPGIPHACVFDTGFHESLPAEAYVYPLPWSWHEEDGLRRYGFHGLSVDWAVRRAGELLARSAAELCLVVAHLGSGCSVTAVEHGRSVSTSMGLTPLEGLMMGTRAGSVDPGLLLRVLRDGRLTPEELAEVLDHQSGLLGVSGVSGDVREVERAAAEGSERAALSLRMFARRAAEGIAAAATALPRLDALVFSGGIGENAAALRADIVRRLDVLGVPAIEAEESASDRLLSSPAHRPAVLRVEAREDVIIAESVTALLAGTGGPTRPA
ncbi:MAG TPA: acetate/propionate family kinase [Candidatus Limnocylindria bacterium]|nr:acetate/propionate family kinase [Candidatus Limnocylindria bacterium]